MFGAALLRQEFGDADEVPGFVDVKPGGAEGNGEAGGLAGGDRVGEGVFGGPADAGEHGGMGAAGGDGPIAAIVGRGEGNVGGGVEHGGDVGIGHGGGVRAEQQGGNARREGVEHAIAEVAGGLEGWGNVFAGEIVCGRIEMQFDFSKPGEPIEHRIDEEFVQYDRGRGSDGGGEPGFDAAWFWRFGEEQDDGTHEQIVEYRFRYFKEFGNS